MISQSRYDTAAMTQEAPSTVSLAQRLITSMSASEARSRKTKDWEHAAAAALALAYPKWSSVLEQFGDCTPAERYLAYRRLIACARDDRRSDLVAELISKASANIPEQLKAIQEPSADFERFFGLPIDQQYLVTLALAALPRWTGCEVLQHASKFESIERWSEFFSLVISTNDQALRADAFPLVYQRLVPRLKRFLAAKGLEQVADDAISDAMEKLLRRPFIERVRSWLNATAFDLAKKIQEKNTRFDSDTDDYQTDMASFLKDCQTRNENEIVVLAEYAKSCMEETLTGRANQLITLHFLGGLSFEDIGNQLSISTSNAYNIRTKALQTLRDCINGKRG